MFACTAQKVITSMAVAAPLLRISMDREVAASDHGETPD